MANKNKILYVCSNCDAQFLKWNGRCLECGAWGTLQQQSVSEEKNGQNIEVSPAEVIDLRTIKKQDFDRIKTNISEVDRVLGGGIVPGSLILWSGEPGIGKSTILAQIVDAIGKKEKVVYVSGEESASQVRDRLDRLNCSIENINFISETDVEKVIVAVKKIKPALAVVDSIQTMYSPSVLSETGSINQIRSCTVRFLELAKKDNISAILVGHITKDGQVAGPKLLEHIVDVVVYLESDPAYDYRMLRTTKNRFGSVNELGIFEMTGAGFKEIKNPSSMFIEAHNEKISGSVISCIMEGTRPFLVEIQALVTKTVFGYPQRKASGFDLNRLQVLTAVLTKRAGINLTNQDVILNVVGGLKVNDPALDLAVCTAIASALLNQIVERDTIVLGEVGLGGEIRNVGKIKERLAEAEKLGFSRAIVPDAVMQNNKIVFNKIKKISEITKSLI